MKSEIAKAIRHPGIAKVWMEKYAVFKQDDNGTPVNVDYMFLSEVLPYRAEDVYHVHGFRGAEAEPFVTFGPGAPLAYVNEWLIDRKARSHDSPNELEAAFPNVDYRYRIEDAKGTQEITLAMGGEDGVTAYPNAPRVSFEQSGESTRDVDWQRDLVIRWTAFDDALTANFDSPTYSKNTIFVLIDNCRGETVYTSGSGNKGEPMDPTATEFTVPAGIFEPGIHYAVFVCFIKYRATDTVTAGAAVICGVAVNSAVTEAKFHTRGDARNSRECPPVELKANYRWPGKLRSAGELLVWPVDDSGLRLPAAKRLRSGGG